MISANDYVFNLLKFQRIQCLKLRLRKTNEVESSAEVIKQCVDPSLCQNQDLLLAELVSKSKITSGNDYDTAINCCSTVDDCNSAEFIKANLLVFLSLIITVTFVLNNIFLK